VLGCSVDVWSVTPPGRSRGGAGAGGPATVTSPSRTPSRPARPGRRSAYHRAPYRWRPGCSCPMLT